MSLDCLKQKWDIQVTVEITFLFFKHEIFLDIEVKTSDISNSTEDLRLIFREVENHLHRDFVEVRRLDDFFRVDACLCFRKAREEPKYNAHRKVKIHQE